jgi:hypothetical protein
MMRHIALQCIEIKVDPILYFNGSLTIPIVFSATALWYH